MGLINYVLMLTVLGMLVSYLNDGPRISVQIQQQLETKEMNIVSDVISAYVWGDN